MIERTWQNLKNVLWDRMEKIIREGNLQRSGAWVPQATREMREEATHVIK
jgi:hypothetical protein